MADGRRVLGLWRWDPSLVHSAPTREEALTHAFTPISGLGCTRARTHLARKHDSVRDPGLAPLRGGATRGRGMQARVTVQRQGMVERERTTTASAPTGSRRASPWSSSRRHRHCRHAGQDRLRPRRSVQLPAIPRTQCQVITENQVRTRGRLAIILISLGHGFDDLL